jgi:hypothetical protein
VALLDAYIRQAQAAGRPVHLGPPRGAETLRDATLRGQPDIEPGAGAGWRWTPIGLTWRATQAGSAAPSLAPLAWRVAPFNQVVLTAPERKIQATRGDMAVLRGLYRANQGDLAGAAADWQLALAVDPAHQPAQEWLSRLKKTP